MFDTSPNMPDEGPPVLARWTIDPTAGAVREATLSDHAQEFPRVDERVVGRPHRYGYYVHNQRSLYGGAIKHDLDRGTAEIRAAGPGRFMQEAVFVPRHDDAAEDDGCLMAYVHDESTQTADVEIWASQDFTGDAVARIHLGHRVPFRFHGNWVSDPG